MADVKRVHFEKLVECCRGIFDLTPGKLKSAWLGRSTTDWIEAVKKGGEYAVLNDINPGDFCNDPFDRKKLSERISIARSRNDLRDQELRDLVIEIFAWGVMSVRNARLALPKWNDWKGPCKSLLQGCDANDAYKQFYDFQEAGKLNGLGPAYYTKLIYFLGQGSGLIMDQWTSRSINLLFGGEIVKLQPGQPKATKSDRSYTVKQTNDWRVYAAYNRKVSDLADRLSGCLPRRVGLAEAEEFIFSFSTDRRKSPHLNDEEFKVITAWRKYVEENHRP